MIQFDDLNIKNASPTRSIFFCSVVNLVRHCEGGTTAAISLYRIEMRLPRQAKSLSRNDVSETCFSFENLLIEFLKQRRFYKYFREQIKTLSHNKQDFPTPLEMTVLKGCFDRIGMTVSNNESSNIQHLTSNNQICQEITP